MDLIYIIIIESTCWLLVVIAVYIYFRNIEKNPIDSETIKREMELEKNRTGKVDILNFGKKSIPHIGTVENKNSNTDSMSNKITFNLIDKIANPIIEYMSSNESKLGNVAYTPKLSRRQRRAIEREALGKKPFYKTFLFRMLILVLIAITLDNLLHTAQVIEQKMLQIDIINIRLRFLNILQ